MVESSPTFLSIGNIRSVSSGKFVPVRYTSEVGVDGRAGTGRRE
jgi:hypothetical protein